MRGYLGNSARNRSKGGGGNTGGGNTGGGNTGSGNTGGGNNNGGHRNRNDDMNRRPPPRRRMEHEEVITFSDDEVISKSQLQLGKNLLNLNELKAKPPVELVGLADSMGIENMARSRKQDIIFAILQAHAQSGEDIFADGVLEILQDGFGFLRSADSSYLAGPDDIYVSPSQIRRMSLRTGYIVEGPIRLPIENQDNFALMQIELVNGRNPDEGTAVTSFEDLTPLHPNARLVLETTPDELSMRIVDLITPVGKGQRGLIVAPPRTGIQPMDKAWVVMNTEMLNVDLGLNDEQKAKVKEIDERFVKKHDAVEALVPKPTDTEMSKKVETLMNDRDDALRAVLNKDQYAKWEKKRHMGTSELKGEQKEKMEEKKN